MLRCGRNGLLRFVRTIGSHQVRSKKIVVEASALEFSKRNEVVLGNLQKYYPTVSSLVVNSRYQLIGVTSFIEKYQKIDTDQDHVLHYLRGRIKSIRYSGKKICFIDLAVNYDEKLQLIVNFNLLSDETGVTDTSFADSVRFLKAGDYIQCYGYPGLSQSKLKMLSLKCTRLPELLSVAQQPLPPKLEDHQKIRNNRVIDYQVNGISTIMLRSFIIKQIRNFLDKDGFVEVDTPILSSTANGALARPFQTVLNAESNVPLQLRIAPELWLKRLIISGMDKVYEIGKNFRNEGIDQIHNPEFTTLEFYQSFCSFEELITKSEQLFKYILLALKNSPLLRQSADAETIVNALIEELSNNDWKFKRLEFLPTLTKEINNGVDYTLLDCDNTTELLDSLPDTVRETLFDQNSELTLSPQQIMNKLSEHFIEKKHCNTLLPTVLYHQPTVLSPLSKANSLNPKVSNRFEIFISGTEYINAYEEENCPQLQHSKFVKQQQTQEKTSDKELLTLDTQYVEAMKWGMPPVGGFGLGIDRLCMLLLNKPRIDSVLTFGCVDAVNKQ